MGEVLNIPILGMDARPTKRRQISGLAENMVGVRPEGFVENPQWVPIENVNEFQNGSLISFNHSNESNLLKLFWHKRSRNGKHGSTDGSLSRLVGLFNDGTIEIIDPDLSPGFATVVSHSVSSTDSGSWDISFTQLYDTGFITVTKGGIPQQDLILEDDLLIPFEFPELPIMRAWREPSDDAYSQEQLDAGSHEGLDTGRLFIRYAFRLRDGSLVKHSAPELIITSTYDQGDSTFKTSFLRFFMEGYGQTTTPSDFEYWKDKISGVAVLCTNSTQLGLTELDQFLKEAVWYELTDFDYIDPTDEVELQDLWRLVTSNEEAIPALPNADIDDGTHHAKSHGTCDTYNSRVMLGQEKEDYILPFLNQKEGLYNHLLIRNDKGLRVVGNPSTGTTVTLTNTSNMSNIVVTDEGNGSWLITYDSSGAISFTLNVTCDRAKSFSVIVSGTDLDYLTQNSGVTVISPSTYSEYTGAGSALQRVFQVEVELETESGEYKRTSAEFTAYTDATGNWSPQGSVLFYPDNRAKQFSIYAELPNAGTQIIQRQYRASMKKGERANYATIFLFGGVVYSGSTIGFSWLYPSLTENSELLVVPDKVRLSQVNSPLAYGSTLVYRIGRSTSRVVGFAVNAIEVSEGQFGQYPLFVFKEDSIWALEQSASADVVFSVITPIDVSQGIDSENKLINLGKLIVFANAKGIYVLGGTNPEPISDPVHDILGSIVAIGQQKRDDDERELLVALDTGVTYHYSTKFKRWYTSAKDIRHFLNVEEDLYALENVNDDFLDFQSTTLNEVDVLIELKNIHFGIPDKLKRFRYAYLRGELNTSDDNKLDFRLIFGSKIFSSVKNLVGSKKIRPKWKSEYMADITISAKMIPETHYLEEITTEVEVRYPHKVKS
jgi:hypothetical protein